MTLYDIATVLLKSFSKMVAYYLWQMNPWSEINTAYSNLHVSLGQGDEK